MLIFGFVCSILIGISLGLIGSGGSILMMPVLVYLFLAFYLRMEINCCNLSFT